ncbi:MAG: transglycosylase SLT domain-containing protein [Oscillospiraceae bacterium]|nr:transglycosylase SLT domain-containing protein [Oscillospiraceae bacterium]
MRRITKIVSLFLILAILLSMSVVATAAEQLVEFIGEPPLEALYEVYKNGTRVNASPEIQHMIRDFAQEYDFCEKIIMGMIVHESTFNPRAHNKTGNWRGLAQISPFWITTRQIERFTDNYKSRDLFNPYDNLLTLMEMWSYARDKYNLDLSTDHGYIQLLFWHSTGRNPKNVRNGTRYTRQVLKFVDELVNLQPQEDVYDYYQYSGTYY